jgi:hypothetical protein
LTRRRTEHDIHFFDSKRTLEFEDSDNGDGGIIGGSRGDTAEGGHGFLLGAEIAPFLGDIYRRISEDDFILEDG